jgi:FMN-dependent oxidoreductase (nitrilotriacetate monooxygenase family)
VFEPVTLLSALAMHTTRIGLLATATTTYEEPYTLARKFASLDHLSQGRACWNIVTTSNELDSHNFGKDEHLARYDRYERAREFVEVCKGLWDSWAEDAFLQDKATGRYLDISKVRLLNHKGKHFSIRGPLNVARCPQGYPILFSAGQSEPGRELAAAVADCMFAATPTKPQAIKLLNDVKDRMAKYGRALHELRVLPGAVEELQSLITPTIGVHNHSHYVSMDLSKYPIDGPFPDLSEAVGGTSRRYAIAELAKRENLTIRQTYLRMLPSFGHIVMKGDGKQIADQIEDWYKSKACDGFNIHVGMQPQGLTSFVDHVIPELQRRGLFRMEYEGRTLRETMGFPKPINPYFTNSRVAAE